MAREQTNIAPMRRSARRVGLEAADRRRVAELLSDILADTYSLLIRTQCVHWNVRGPAFHSIHTLTEQQYKALFKAIDIVAERILALGYHVPAKNGASLTPDTLRFDPQQPADAMLEALAAHHESCAKGARDAAEAADEADDIVTADMLTDRLAEHEKAIWMLRAQKQRQGE